MVDYTKIQQFNSVRIRARSHTEARGLRNKIKQEDSVMVSLANQLNLENIRTVSRDKLSLDTRM